MPALRHTKQVGRRSRATCRTLPLSGSRPWLPPTRGAGPGRPAVGHSKVAGRSVGDPEEPLRRYVRPGHGHNGNLT